MKLIINDRIRDREVKFFTNMELNLKYDTVASDFKFDFYFNPENPELKDLACVGHYHIVRIEHNGQTLLTGNILDEEFSGEPSHKLVSFQGGSLPGVLEDVNLTTALQSIGLSLKDVTDRLIKPFNLKVVYDDSIKALVEAQYNEVTAKHTHTIKEYLSELASQKNIVLSHDEFGRLVFRRARPGVKPVTTYEQQIPSTRMKLSFGGQQIHSHITVMEQADFEEEVQTSVKTVTNPFVIGTVYRPRVVIKNAGNTDLDTEQAAKNLRAQELKNVRLTIFTDRWEVNGRVLMPGKIISVLNPNVYLFKKANWFVESVSLRGAPDSLTAQINCVPPCVYDGSEPVYYWKGINLH